MKLQISFDILDLNKALTIAHDIANHADIIEIGTILLYHHGIQSIEKFKNAFPHKIIFANTKIVDHAKEIVELFAKAGADWVSIMAGASSKTIHTATTAAHALDIKTILDLTDASSIGQSAMEAKNLGADALLFSQPYKEQDALIFLDQWDMIKGNTSLPIFVSATTNRENISQIISIKPDVIVVGHAIINAENSNHEAHFFADLITTL